LTGSSPPQSSRRGSGRSSSQGGSFTTEHIGDIVKEAVRTALDAAQSQWVTQLRNGTFMHPDFTGPDAFHHRFSQLVAKVDVLGDQVQGLDAQALSLADKSQLEELQRLLVGFEGRLTRLETRMDKLEVAHGSSANEQYKKSSEERENLEKRLADLVERMSSLETSVEAEHETSLDLLEVLLKQQQVAKRSKELSSPTNGTRQHVKQTPRSQSPRAIRSGR
ncbi:unnamed protein product, partial [Symbiodinium microadriaticum]